MISKYRTSILEKMWIPELLIYIFAAECVIGGSGRWLSFGSVSIRILLFILCFLATLPFLFIKKREMFRSSYIVVILVFGAAVLFSALIGFRNGNSLQFIWSDISSFLTLALLPGILAVIDNDIKLNRLLNVIFYASLFTALVTIAIHMILPWMSDLAINNLNIWINDRSLGGLAMLETGLNRVYFRAQIFLQFSALLGIWKIWNRKGAARVALCFCEGFIIFAIVISYTRGFWLGLVFSVVFAFVLERRHWKKLIGTAGIALASLLVLCGVSAVCYGQPFVLAELVNRFDENLIVLSAPEQASDEDAVISEAVTEKTGEEAVDDQTQTSGAENNIVAEANEKAVKLREDSLIEMNNKITQHPIIGSGLGTNLDNARDDGKTEYMYLDITMKMGMIGLLIFICAYMYAPAKLMIRRIKDRKEKDSWQGCRVRNSLLIAGYLGVALSSAFNPFLTSPMGILMLAVITLCAFQTEPANRKADITGD